MTTFNKYSYLILLIFLLGCSSVKPIPTKTVPDFDFSTNISNYPALKTQTVSNIPSGFLGFIKLYAEHRLKDENGAEGFFVAQGTGIVVRLDNKLYIVTARHLVIPEKTTESLKYTNTKGEKKEIQFKKITNTGSKIALGYTGVQPVSIYLSPTQDLDLAVLVLSDSSYSDMIYNKMDDSFSLGDQLIKQGTEVEAWGYPAKQSAQMEKLFISDLPLNHITLNHALNAGYSGGVIFIPGQNGKKMVSGMIIRADDAINQSVAIRWSAISSFISSMTQPFSSAIKIEFDKEVTIDGVRFIYFGPDDNNLSMKPAKNWYEFWK